MKNLSGIARSNAERLVERWVIHITGHAVRVKWVTRGNRHGDFTLRRARGRRFWVHQDVSTASAFKRLPPEPQAKANVKS